MALAGRAIREMGVNGQNFWWHNPESARKAQLATHTTQTKKAQPQPRKSLTYHPLTGQIQKLRSTPSGHCASQTFNI